MKAPADPAEKKRSAASAKEPTLENAEEFGLSEVSERPAYRPLVVPRGDDAILSALDPTTHAPGFSPPTAAGQVTFDPPAREVDEELTLSAPVERLEIKPTLPLPPVVIDDDPEARLRDGRYENDDLIGAGGVNRKAPDAWKKAPFLLGLAEFLLQPETLSRWLLYSLGGGCILVFLTTAVALAFSSDPGHQLIAIFAFGASGLIGGFFIFLLSAVLSAIVEDTANGRDVISSWPDWNIGDWFFRGAQVLAAGFISGLAGMVAAYFLVAAGVPWAAPLVMIGCLVALFPLVMYSMLVENSILAIYSPRTGHSMHRAPEAWMLFYLYSVGLGIFGGAFAVLTMVPYVAAMVIGGAGLITIAFIYFRVLGRLLWYCEEKATRLPSEKQPTSRQVQP